MSRGLLEALRDLLEVTQTRHITNHLVQGGNFYYPHFKRVMAHAQANGLIIETITPYKYGRGMRRYYELTDKGRDRLRILKELSP